MGLVFTPPKLYSNEQILASQQQLMTVVGVWNKIGTLASVQYCENDVSFSYGWSWCGDRFYEANTPEGQCRQLQLLFVRGGTSTIGGNFSRYLSVLVECRH